jgi:hypothetical protein
LRKNKRDGRKMKKKAIYILLLFISIIIPLYADGDDGSFTVADVASSEAGLANGITSMAASVSTTTQYNGISQTIQYDYAMSVDASGNEKVMVTTGGLNTMQFLVDTSDMSVTYLMADGSLKKVTVSAEAQEEIKGLTGVMGISGMTGSGGLYASLGMDRKTMSDASNRRNLNTNRIETDDAVISVKGKKGNGRGLLGMGSGDDTADVEYDAKDNGTMVEKFAEAQAKIASARPKNEAGEELKEKAIKLFAEKKELAMKTTIGKRIEHINMRTGMVEGQEMYSVNGEKIGDIKVKAKTDVLDTAKGNKYEMATDTETDMDAGQGKSKNETKINNIRLNEPVEFEWIKTNRR